MPRVKVTGYMNIDDDEFDATAAGPLTEDAYNDIMGMEIEVIEDITFTLVPE